MVVIHKQNYHKISPHQPSNKQQTKNCQTAIRSGRREIDVKRWSKFYNKKKSINSFYRRYCAGICNCYPCIRCQVVIIAPVDNTFDCRGCGLQYATTSTNNRCAIRSGASRTRLWRYLCSRAWPNCSVWLAWSSLLHWNLICWWGWSSAWKIGIHCRCCDSCRLRTSRIHCSGGCGSSNTRRWRWGHMSHWCGCCCCWRDRSNRPCLRRTNRTNSGNRLNHLRHINRISRWLRRHWLGARSRNGGARWNGTRRSRWGWRWRVRRTTSSSSNGSGGWHKAASERNDLTRRRRRRGIAKGRVWRWRRCWGWRGWERRRRHRRLLANRNSSLFFFVVVFVLEKNKIKKAKGN